MRFFQHFTDREGKAKRKASIQGVIWQRISEEKRERIKGENQGKNQREESIAEIYSLSL